MENTIELVLSLLVAVVVLSTLARRVNIPYPVVLVLGGLLLSAIPHLPTISLEPDIVLLIFLPPLVYSAAWHTSVRDLRDNLRSILFLAIGLVIFTTVLVAQITFQAIAELTLPAAYVLGAILSPTDTVTADAIVSRLGVPRRVLSIIEGESLLNDATGLTLYTFAAAAAASGTFSLALALPAIATFALVVLGGTAIGLAVAVAGDWIQQRILDVPTGVTYSLLLPYAAYLPAQALGLSGVLAAVVAGLYSGWREPKTLSSEARLQATSVWNTMVFVVNGLIFILVGLQLHRIITQLVEAPQAGARTYTPLTLLWYALLTTLVVVIVRVVWVFVASYLPRILSRNLRARDPYPGWRNVLIVAWTGMRGGVSLAAALALVASQRFPQSQINLLTFLVFGVILGTLLLQGLTLPLLITVLQLADSTAEASRDAMIGRLEATRAALRYLADTTQRPEASAAGIQQLQHFYQQREAHLGTHLNVQGDLTGSLAADPVHDLRDLRRELLTVERDTIIRMRNHGTIGEAALRRLERDLDLEELRL